MTSPLVSIVIPAYNAEVFLDRTLASATQQTYTNLEIIVVNDGSKDGTLQLAQRAAAADSRIRIISIANGGVANARNVGTAEANGEFVAFLDADDLWHPTKIELQLKALQTPLPDGDLPAASYAFMRLIDGNDIVFQDGRPLAFNGNSLARHLYFRPVGNGSSLLLRRDIILELGGYDPSWAAQGIGGCEDIDFEFKIVAKYPIVCVPLYLVGYREYQGNMSSNRSRMARAVVQTVRTHLERNTHLPWWVTQYTRASTLEYSSSILFWGRHWKQAAASTALLFATQPSRAASFLVRTVQGRLQKLKALTNSAAVKKHSFYQFEPHQGTSPESLLPGDRRMLARLAAIDAMHPLREARTAQAVPSRPLQTGSAIPVRQ